MDGDDYYNVIPEPERFTSPYTKYYPNRLYYTLESNCAMGSEG